MINNPPATAGGTDRLLTRFETMTTPARSIDILEALRIEDYLIENVSEVLTPALAIYAEILDRNIAVTLDLVGSADRWRPHVKTAKLAYVMRKLIDSGVMNFKCSTTLELRVACESGAADVVLAYPAVGATLRRARAIADEFSETEIAALVENSEQIDEWKASRVGLFINVNPGHGSHRHRAGPRGRDSQPCSSNRGCRDRFSRPSLL